MNTIVVILKPSDGNLQSNLCSIDIGRNFALAEDHRHKLMKWFTERHEKDVNTEGILVSKAAQQIKAALNRARRYFFLKSNDFVHEVFSPETIRTYIVRLDIKTCTCFEW